MARAKHHVDLFSGIRNRWCRLMHTAAMWPIRETYQCRICGCTYPVPWAAGTVAPPAGLTLQAKGPILQGGA